MTTTPILYDPDCGFCRVCVAVVLTWDRAGRLRPVPLGSGEAADLLRGMPEAEQMASWHLAEHPEIRSGGAAFSPLFRLLPGGGAVGAARGTVPERGGQGLPLGGRPPRSLRASGPAAACAAGRTA